MWAHLKFFIFSFLSGLMNQCWPFPGAQPNHFRAFANTFSRHPLDRHPMAPLPCSAEWRLAKAQAEQWALAQAAAVVAANDLPRRLPPPPPPPMLSKSGHGNQQTNDNASVPTGTLSATNNRVEVNSSNQIPGSTPLPNSAAAGANPFKVPAEWSHYYANLPFLATVHGRNGVVPPSLPPGFHSSLDRENVSNGLDKHKDKIKHKHDAENEKSATAPGHHHHHAHQHHKSREAPKEDKSKHLSPKGKLSRERERVTLAQCVRDLLIFCLNYELLDLCNKRTNMPWHCTLCSMQSFF